MAWVVLRILIAVLFVGGFLNPVLWLAAIAVWGIRDRRSRTPTKTVPSERPLVE